LGGALKRKDWAMKAQFPRKGEIYFSGGREEEQTISEGGSSSKCSPKQQKSGRAGPVTKLRARGGNNRKKGGAGVSRPSARGSSFYKGKAFWANRREREDGVSVHDEGGKTKRIEKEPSYRSEENDLRAPTRQKGEIHKAGLGVCGLRPAETHMKGGMGDSEVRRKNR